MLTENDVVKAVAKHLANCNYEIKSALSTLDRGVDIVAVHRKTAKYLLVEAKGGTSSKSSTARFGLPFNKNQAGSHVSRALLCVAQLREKHQGNGTEVAMAFPDDQNHKGLVEAMRSALATLGIRVFFVDSEHQVVEYDPEGCRTNGLSRRPMRNS